MLIRGADERDAAEIARVHIASWRAAYPGIIPADVLDGLNVDWQARQWKSIITGASCQSIIAESERGCVGLASFAATRDDDDDPTHVGEIQAVYVEPDCWGQGIGWKLCQTAVTELADEGFQQVTLWVLKDNQHARRFYERAGFVPDGRTKMVSIGATLSALRYRKHLDRAP